MKFCVQDVNLRLEFGKRKSSNPQPTKVYSQDVCFKEEVIGENENPTSHNSMFLFVGEILPCNQTKKGPMSATKVLLGNNGAN